MKIILRLKLMEDGKDPNKNNNYKKESLKILKHLKTLNKYSK